MYSGHKTEHTWTHRDKDNMCKTCINFEPEKTSSRKSRKWTQSPTPIQQAINNQVLLGKGNSVFYNGVSLGISTTLQGRPGVQQELVNTKWTVCFLLWDFVSFCFVLVFFVLLGFSLFILIFITFMLLRERMWSWKVGRTWKELGVENHDQNILCVRKVLKKNKTRPIVIISNKF